MRTLTNPLRSKALAYQYAKNLPTGWPIAVQLWLHQSFYGLLIFFVRAQGQKSLGLPLKAYPLASSGLRLMQYLYPALNYPVPILSFQFQYFDFGWGQITINQTDFSYANVHAWHLDYIFNLNLATILHKLKIIIPFFFYYSLINVFFVVGFIILLASNFQKKIDSYIKIVNYYFIFNIILIMCIYLFADREIEVLVRTTMERIIFTTSGFYVFLIINYLKNLNKIFLK